MVPPQHPDLAYCDETVNIAVGCGEHRAGLGCGNGHRLSSATLQIEVRRYCNRYLVGSAESVLPWPTIPNVSHVQVAVGGSDDRLQTVTVVAEVREGT